MTEQEWLQATDPEPMLAFLRGKVSDRKLRYFLVACARRVLPSAPDDDMIEALAMAERFADGEVSRYRLARIRSALKTGHPARVSRWFPLYTTHIRSVPAWYTTREKIVREAGVATRLCACSSESMNFLGYSKELPAQVCLVRDIFSNPFRPITLDPSWLTWHDGLLVSMAQKMYDSRNFGDMPVLADALEEAGCQDQDILGHCRSGGEHVRGCWVVDALLSKS